MAILIIKIWLSAKIIALGSKMVKLQNWQPDCPQRKNDYL